MVTKVIDTTIGAKETFKRVLAAEMERAASKGQPYSVVAVVPQSLEGESVADVVKLAAGRVHELIRKDDKAGLLGDEALVIGLSRTASSGARAFAHRIQGDLGLLTAHVRKTVWEAGFACLLEDGVTAEELLHAALQAAKTRRERLAAQ